MVALTLRLWISHPPGRGGLRRPRRAAIGDCSGGKDGRSCPEKDPGETRGVLLSLLSLLLLLLHLSRTLLLLLLRPLLRLLLLLRPCPA